jgi:hypothetical protein
MPLARTQPAPLVVMLPAVLLTIVLLMMVLGQTAEIPKPTFGPRCW